MSALVVNKSWIDSHETKPFTLADRATSYLRTANGAGRVMQLVQKSVKLSNQITKDLGRTPSEVGVRLEQNLGIATGALGVIRAPGAIIDAARSIQAASEDGSARKIERAVSDTLGAVSAVGYASMFVKYNPTVGTVCGALDLTGDVADFPYAISDYQKAKACEGQSNSPEIKEAFAHTKRYNLLAVAKTALSIATGILGMVLLIVGAPIVPAVILIAPSLLGTTLALAKDQYKTMGKYEVINFDRPVIIA